MLSAPLNQISDNKLFWINFYSFKTPNTSHFLRFLREGWETGYLYTQMREKSES